MLRPWRRRCGPRHACSPSPRRGCRPTSCPSPWGCGPLRSRSTGASAASPFVPALRRSIRGWPIAVLAGALALRAARVVPSIWRQAPAAVPAAAGVLVALGAASVLAAGGALLERRDPGVVFVAVWFGLWALFVWGWSWTVAARFVLPLLPPLAWLLALTAGPARRWLLPAASAASLAVSAVVIQADMFPVAFHRAVVDELAGQAAPTGQRVYFVGGGPVP